MTSHCGRKPCAQRATSGEAGYRILTSAICFTIAATSSGYDVILQEVGPFLPIEQAALTSTTTDRTRTQLLAWYTLTGALATALGAFAAGVLTRVFQQQGSPPVGSYRVAVMLYAALGAILAMLFSRLSPCSELIAKSEASTAGRGTSAGFAGIERSRDVVLKLSSLFALDAFGGGFIAQSFAAYWFHLRFGADPAVVGPIFFVANVLAGLYRLSYHPEWNHASVSSGRWCGRICHRTFC